MAIYYKKDQGAGAGAGGIEKGDLVYKRTDKNYDDYARLNRTTLIEADTDDIILDDPIYNAGDNFVSVLSESNTAVELATIKTSQRYIPILINNVYYAARNSGTFNIKYVKSDDFGTTWSDYSANTPANHRIGERTDCMIKDANNYITFFNGNKCDTFDPVNNVFITGGIVFDNLSSSGDSLIDAHANINTGKNIIFLYDKISTSNGLTRIDLAIFSSNDYTTYIKENSIQDLIKIDTNFPEKNNTTNTDVFLGGSITVEQNGEGGQCYYSGKYYATSSINSKVYEIDENDFVAREVFDFTSLVDYTVFNIPALPALSDIGRFAQVVGYYADGYAILVSDDLINFRVVKYSPLSVTTYPASFYTRCAATTGEGFVMFIPEDNIVSITNNLFDSEFRNDFVGTDIDLVCSNFVYDKTRKEIMFQFASSKDMVAVEQKQQVISLDTKVLYKTPNLTKNDIRDGEIALYTKIK
jgi:hypothetical protein